MKYHQGKCTDLLLDAGADVNMQNHTSETTLHKAAEYGLHMYVHLLIQAGADVNATDERGSTALIKATRYGHSKCAEILVQAGADVNITDKLSTTALIGASASCNVQIVNYLLRKGAYINNTTTEGTNALQHCLTECKPVMVATAKLLFVAGEKLNDIILERNKNETNYQYSKRVEVLEYVKHLDQKLCLQDTCTKAIWKQLIKVEQDAHLFNRMSQIGLPSSITLYLLYDILLD